MLPPYHEEWVQTLSKHKKMNSFFPVKVYLVNFIIFSFCYFKISQSATYSEAKYLCVKSSGVCLTVDAQFTEEV